MGKNNFENFCNILKCLGLNNESNINQCNNSNDEKVKIDPTAGASSNKCRYANLDIPCGFQDIDPMIITVLGELVGNLLSGEIPINVAGALGNWLQLIAQVMTMYIAQQQYSQSGPGRYYNTAYRNVANPFCENPSQPDGGEPIVPKYTKANDNKMKRDEAMEETIRNLNREIEYLKGEIEILKSEINILKYNRMT